MIGVGVGLFTPLAGSILDITPPVVFSGWVIEGGIITSVPDLAAFANATFVDGTLQFGGPL